MNILLINPPKEQEDTFATLTDYNDKARNNNPPLGLLYLYSYLSTKHNVTVVDMSAENLSIHNIVSLLEKHKPDLVGISCIITKWKTTQELAHRIKTHNKNITIVAGGVNPSLYTYETLQCNNIDFVIRGFGQIPLMKLCDQLGNSTFKNDINNCFTKETCAVGTKGKFMFEDVDQYPLPDRTALPINDYHIPYAPENPTTSLVTSLGCPHKCHFCQCSTFKPVKIRKVENVIKELKEIQASGIKSVIFQDELFTMSNARIKAVCSAMLKENIKLHWSVRARADLTDLETLKMMADSNCYNVHFGIESGTNSTLKRMKKNLTIKQIKNSVKTVQQSGISCSASFMLGYPGETEQEILETIDFAAGLNLKVCQFYITIPSPGTELYEEWKLRTGYTGDIFSKFTLNPSDVDLNTNIASDLFSREDMDYFVKLGFSKTDNLYKIHEHNTRRKNAI